MTYLLLGIGLFLLVLLLLNWAANAPPQSIVRSGKWILAILAGLVGLGLIATGRFGLVWMVAFGFLPWLSRFINLRRMLKTMRGPSPGASSTVRSHYFAMALDHETGRMDGEILAGTQQGRKLSELSLSDLLALHAEVVAADRKSADLLEAYLDRVHGADWRQEDSEEEDGAHRQHRARSSSGGMSRAEALAVLGLQEGSTPEEIRDAHKRMMKTAHPDAGGSDYLAAKVNEAKEVLLGKART